MSSFVILALATLAGVANAQTQATYCAISAQNTMCLYKPYIYSTSCPTILPDTVSDADKKQIVDLHNQLRSQVALRSETRGNPGPQPTAANMRAITWDDELAMMADTHARQCVYQHDINRNVARFAVGQNIAKRGTWPNNGVLNWTSPIMSWYNEVTDFNTDLVKSFPGNGASGKVVGHYTQVAWAETYKVGCSVVNWLKDGWYTYFYVCNYGPTGNYYGEAVYQIGTPASACPAGTIANTATGLCV